MALLAVSNIGVLDSKKITLGAVAAGGDTVAATVGCFAVIKNGHAANPRTITFDCKNACNHGYDHNLVVTIPALEEWITKKINPSWFNDATTGVTSITYSDAGADITLQVINLQA